jgi:phospholipid transport system substrate-binding protein
MRFKSAGNGSQCLNYGFISAGAAEFGNRSGKLSRKTLSTVVVVLWALVWTAAARAALPPAMPEARQLGDRILSISRAPSCKANNDACRERLRTLIEQYWDTSEMARSALGYHWKALNEQQRQQFTKLFSDLVEAIYLSRSMFSKAEAYSDTLRVNYIREVSEGENYRKIDTTVMLKPGQRPIKVDYRMRWVDGRWKVYDVIVEDISLTGNYRNQFNRIINSHGFPELVHMLQDKLNQIRASEGA